MTGFFTLDPLMDVDIPKDTWARIAAQHAPFPIEIWSPVKVPYFGEMKAIAVLEADDPAYTRVRGYKVERKAVPRGRA